MMKNLNILLLTALLVVLCSFQSIANGQVSENAYQNSSSQNIVFADAKVKALCVQNWDINVDGELSESEAAVVTSLNYVFSEDSTITSFNELRYFTGLKSIDQYAFCECTSLKSIELPNSITNIDYGAFYGCRELECINIPNTVVSIGVYAFRGCSSLASVTLSEAMTEISYGVFIECSNLTSVIIPNSITIIDEFAFDDCSSLTSVSIPNSVDSIGRCAFYGCDALDEVYCYVSEPSTISMGSSVFYRNQPSTNRYLYIPLGSIDAYLSSLNWRAYFGHIIEIGGSSSPNIEFADPNVKVLCVQHWDRNDDGELSQAEAAIISNLSNVFKDNTTITSFDELIYFTGLNSINSYAFRGCTNLMTITLPNSIKKIGDRAFFECNKLASIDIPNSVISIDYGAFYECRGLTCVTIPKSVNEICENAFYNCNSLERVIINDIEAWCNIDFENLGNPLVSARHLYLNDQEITDLTIPNSVATIKEYAFQGCDGIISVTIPNTVKNIEPSAFKSCGGITSIDIPNSVESIGHQAFAGCISLYQATIPESVKFIGYSAFSQSENLTEVYSLIADLSLVTTEWDVFSTLSHDYSNRTLHVPLGSLDDYLASSRWSPYFAHIIEMGGSSSPNIAFADSRVKALCVHNWDRNGDGELNEAEAATVTSLNNVFRGNSNITSFNEFRYFTNVTSIADSEFSECYMMKNISIPNSVTEIGRMAFSDCYSLENVSIPENVTSINEMTFVGCSNLTNVSIANSVNYIGNQAFAFCSKLTSVIIPNSVTEIDTYAFQRCSNLSRITIGNSVAKIGFYAFYECDNIIEVINKSINPPKLSNWYCFTSPVYCNAKLLVPYNSLDEYKNATYWKNFSYIFGTDDDNNILAEGLTLEITNKELEIDESFTITATISPSIVANNTLSWSSSNSNIAVVNNSGKVTAISAGNVIIKATTTDGTNISASCNVTVRKRLVSSILLNKSSTTIYAGDTEQLTATLSPSDASDTTLTWTSSNTNIAIVNNDGLITAISAGTAIITAKTTDGSNLSASCTVTVRQRMATSISLNQTSATLYSGESIQLSATVLPSNADDRSVTWTSNNPSVAIVSSSGLVTAISAGNVTITAKTADGSNLSASCSITVKQYATSISLNKTTETLYMGNTLQLSATVYPNSTSDKSVSWSSSNTDVATVSSDGLVTPKSTGTATITVRTEDGSNLTAQCIVTVKQYATSISLSETDVTVYTGTTLQLTATVLPNTTSNSSVTWSSSNTNVATVSSTGLVTAVSTGNAEITAKTADGSNLSASCNVTVKRLATSISLNKTSATLYLDQTIQLNATVSPSNATDMSVVWSSSENNIASVTSTGLVTAVAPGNATITATTADGSNLSASCEITVKAYVTSLTLDQSEATILEGDTLTLIPTILPTYATNQSLNWSSSNTSVVSVNNGVVVGRSGGEATITARTADGSNLSATCKMTVTPNFDLSMPNLSHLRGSMNNKFDLTIDLANRYDITGLQFDIQFPDGVTIAKDNYGEYDILLDDARKTRNHTATASLISSNTYRILVSSATANSFKGHSGTVLHIMIEIPLYHVSGNKQVKYSNIILSEPDETRHTLSTRYSMISYYYKEGDANADVSVDVADYVITGNYILQNTPEYFWYDAANVDHNSTIDVNDLTGITNIALGRREGGILQMPAIQSPEDNKDVELTANPLVIQAGQTKTLNLSLNGIYEFAGFQMDLRLPSGIRIIDASLVGENNDLGIASAELADGSIRLLASSFSLKNLAVNNTAFLKLSLTAESSFNGNDIITLDNIKFSERNMVLHTFENVVIPIGNDKSSLEDFYSEIRIYGEGNNIIIDCPASGTVSIVTIAGITQVRDVLPGHNVIQMEDAGFYIVTINGTTAKLRLN